MRKKMFIVSQALLFMGVLGIVFAGCGTPQGSDLADKQIFTYPIVASQDVKTLDPALITDLYSAQVISLIGSGLVSLDPKTLAVKPNLASSWDVSADGKSYTFHIRPNLKFSNGDPLTANDFAYAIDRAFGPDIFGTSYTPDYYLGGQGGINAGIVGGEDRGNGKIPSMIGQGLVVVNDTTLQINITGPALWFLEALTYPVSYPVDKKVVDQFGASWWDGHFVGAGPFELKSFQHKVKLVAVPNPNWWGDKPTLTEVDMPIIADSTTSWNNFQANQVDVSPVPAADYNIAKAYGPSRFYEGPSLSVGYVAPNSKVAPFDNVTVRQAFAESVDRDKLANQVLSGASLPSNHIVPQGMPGYNANLKGLPFDPNDAKAKLLSVYPDVSKMPAVTLEYSKSVTGDKLYAAMQQDWQTYLGVHVNLNAVDFGQLLNDVGSKNAAGIYPNQFYALGWIADYPDPQDFMDLVISTSSNNNMNFSNTDVDGLVAKGDSGLDANARLGFYNQAEEIAVQQVAWIPITQGKTIYVFQKWVSGYNVSAQGTTPDIAWSSVKILKH
jgi:peptide/nickel transport system substrate-binding protein/oligopeptide transport system substrate-binding protein